MVIQTCECLVTTWTVIVSGEITTSTWVNFQDIARKTIREIWYNSHEACFSADDVSVQILINMLVKTQALILQTTKFKETSLIVKAYTQSNGVLSFLINGVRTEKNANKAVLFQPLNFLDIIIYYKENKNLLYLKEYKFNTLYKEIPFNIIKSSIALLMLEVVEHALNKEEEMKNSTVLLNLAL